MALMMAGPPMAVARMLAASSSFSSVVPRVLALAQEPLVRLLEPTLALVIDRVPQARKRIADAEQQVAQAIIAGDAPRALNWMGKHIRDLRRGYEVAGITLDTTVSTVG